MTLIITTHTKKKEEKISFQIIKELNNLQCSMINMKTTRQEKKLQSVCVNGLSIIILITGTDLI